MTNLVITPLLSVQDEVLIKDMNYEFHYKRIVKPNGQKADLFNLCYKEKSMDDWFLCNGCISEQYKVVRTEEIIKQITEKLGARVAKKSHFRYETSVKCSFILSDFVIDLPQDAETDKFIFKLVTGIDSDISVLSKAALSFNVINGFSGNRKLTLNYGFLKTIHGDVSGEDRPVTSNNMFILDEYSKDLIHDDRNLEISYAEISNIEQSVQSKIELFKNIPLVDEWLEEFYSKFPKKFVKKVQGMMDVVPNTYKNLYYLSFILGFILDMMRNLSLETNLRNHVKKYVEGYVRAGRSS